MGKNPEPDSSGLGRLCRYFGRGWGPLARSGATGERIMRKHPVVAVAAAAGVLVIAGGAAAAGRYLITSTHQIKPSVVAQLRGNRGPQGPPGPPGTNGANGANGVVPKIVLVDSEKLSLAPGQNSYQVDPNNFQANCPAGYTTFGTGFSGPFPRTGGFVTAYGFFVGGFFANESSITVNDVYLQAVCGAVPQGSIGPAADRGGAESAYHARLASAAAFLR
jgi:hypothetical protein